MGDGSNGGDTSSQSFSGLIAVTCATVVIAALAVIALYLLKNMKDGTTPIVSIATAAFGVISTMVGGYVGVKVGTESAKGSITDAARSGVREAGRAHARAAAYEQYVPADQKAAAKAAGDAAAGSVGS